MYYNANKSLALQSHRAPQPTYRQPKFALPWGGGFEFPVISVSRAALAPHLIAHKQGQDARPPTLHFCSSFGRKERASLRFFRHFVNCESRRLLTHSSARVSISETLPVTHRKGLIFAAHILHILFTMDAMLCGNDAWYPRTTRCHDETLHPLPAIQAQLFQPFLGHLIFQYAVRRLPIVNKCHPCRFLFTQHCMID